VVSGIVTEAASWSGCIEVRVYRDKCTNLDMFEIRQKPWRGTGIHESIACGVIGEPSLERFGTIKTAEEWQACQESV
jgi:hypothetical protein